MTRFPLGLAVLCMAAACGGGTSSGGGTTPTQPTPDQAPTANLSVSPDSGYAPLSVEVKVTGTDSDGSVAHYKLDTTGNGTYDVDDTTAIDTTLSYQATTRPQAQVVDDQGKASASVSHQVTIRATATLTVQTAGASPDPGVGIESLDGITVVLAGGSGADTAVSQGGAATFTGLHAGSYVITEVSDNPADPPGTIGAWQDITVPDTLDVKADTTVEKTLFPWIAPAPGDTVYGSGLIYAQQLHGPQIQMPPNDPGQPTVQGYPERMEIDTAGMPSPAWADSIRLIFSDWNGPTGAYDNFTFVPFGQAHDWVVRFADSLPSGQQINSFIIDNTHGIWYVNPAGIGLANLVPDGRHEAYFISSLGNTEARNSVGVYCAEPAPCYNLDLTELQVLEVLKVLRAHYYNGYNLMQYDPSH